MKSSSQEFAIYRCTFCAYEFDEEQEFPVYQKYWEDLPINFACPECGGSKLNFDKVK